MNMVALIAGISVLSLVFCHHTAKRKGLRPVFWGVLGLLLGPIAIVAVIAAKSRVQNQP